MLASVKLALRVSHDHMDDEIEGLIAAAQADLTFSGVQAYPENETLIKRAVITYCKANFGYDNPEAERFERSYGLLKQSLCIYTPVIDGESNAT